MTTQELQRQRAEPAKGDHRQKAAGSSFRALMAMNLAIQRAFSTAC
jgi:hypothetical protein